MLRDKDYYWGTPTIITEAKEGYMSIESDGLVVEYPTADQWVAGSNPVRASPFSKAIIQVLMHRMTLSMYRV